jgi:hypothetical protein
VRKASHRRKENLKQQGISALKMEDYDAAILCYSMVTPIGLYAQVRVQMRLVLLLYRHDYRRNISFYFLAGTDIPKLIRHALTLCIPDLLHADYLFRSTFIKF